MVEISEYFAVMGDPTRMQILRALSEEKLLRAKDVLGHVSISQPTLSHHMRILVEKEIVIVKRIGRECFYTINSDTVSEMVSELKSLQGKHKADQSGASDISEVKKKKNKSKKEEKEKHEKRKKKKEKK